MKQHVDKWLSTRGCRRIHSIFIGVLALLPASRVGNFARGSEPAFDVRPNDPMTSASAVRLGAGVLGDGVAVAAPREEAGPDAGAAGGMRGGATAVHSGVPPFPPCLHVQPYFSPRCSTALTIALGIRVATLTCRSKVGTYAASFGR